MIGAVEDDVWHTVTSYCRTDQRFVAVIVAAYTGDVAVILIFNLDRLDLFAVTLQDDIDHCISVVKSQFVTTFPWVLSIHGKCAEGTDCCVKELWIGYYDVAGAVRVEKLAAAMGHIHRLIYAVAFYLNVNIKSVVSIFLNGIFSVVDNDEVTCTPIVVGNIHVVSCCRMWLVEVKFDETVNSFNVAGRCGTNSEKDELYINNDPKFHRNYFISIFLLFLMYMPRIGLFTCTPSRS